MVSYRTLLLLAALSAAPAAWAQTVSIRVDDRAAEMLGRNVSVVEDLIESEIETETKALLGEQDTRAVLEASANIQSLVNKGLGADYSLRVDGFVFGIGVSAGVANGGAELEVLRDTGSGETTTVPAGAGAQLSLLLGYNLTAVGLPWLTLYAHGLAAPVNVSDFSGSFYNLGVSAQARILPPVGAPLLRWGGLAVTTGFEASRTRFDLTPEDAIGLSTQFRNITIVSETGSGIELVQRSLSIPLELTSSVHLLRALTIYGGLGLDLNFGRAALQASLDTVVRQGAAETNPGALTVDFDDGADSDRTSFRLLAGAQADLRILNLFAQVNLRPDRDAISAAAGLRLLF